jgi:hypothetical protein
MGTNVSRAGVTAAVAKKAGQRRQRARFQFGAEHILRLCHILGPFLQQSAAGAGLVNVSAKSRFTATT